MILIFRRDLLFLRSQSKQHRVRRCATPKISPTTSQIIRANSRHSDGPYAQNLFHVVPRPFCAPLQAKGTDFEMHMSPAFPLAAHYHA